MSSTRTKKKLKLLSKSTKSLSSYRCNQNACSKNNSRGSRCCWHSRQLSSRASNNSRCSQPSHRPTPRRKTRERVADRKANFRDHRVCRGPKITIRISQRTPNRTRPRRVRLRRRHANDAGQTKPLPMFQGQAQLVRDVETKTQSFPEPLRPLHRKEPTQRLVGPRETKVTRHKKSRLEMQFQPLSSLVSASMQNRGSQSRLRPRLIRSQREALARIKTACRRLEVTNRKL